MKLMNEQSRHRQQEYDKQIKVLKHKYEFEHAYESKLEEENMRLWKEEKHKLCAHVE